MSLDINYTAPLTFTYHKSASGAPITLDVYIAPNPTSTTTPLKTIVYFHGGGLMAGSKTSPLQPTLYNQLHAHNYTIISPDYRLLPESTVWDLRDDVAVLETWLLAKASNPELSINLKNLAVGGCSAGAYLAMLTPDVWTTLKPRGMLNFFGMVDVTDDWYTKRKPAGTISMGIPIDSLQQEWFIENFAPGKDEIFSDPVVFGDIKARFGMFLWAIREGILFDMITGHWKVGGLEGPKPQRDVKKLTPLELVREGYPPIVSVHGDMDSIVPIEGSYHLGAKLKDFGVGHELIVVPGAEHGLQPEAKNLEYFVKGVKLLERWMV